MNKKIISSFEIALLVIATFAFAYLINIPLTEASQFLPTGCCPETKDGAVCQDMLLSDDGMCKGSLIATECEQVSECEKGCCYDRQAGLCSLNSPKTGCIDLGGEWTDNSDCNIPQCKIGCCILGDQVSETTLRECSLLSDEYDFNRDFRALDAFGTCSSYIGLHEKGACLTPTDDFTGKNECSYITRGECSGEFVEGFLCSSEELNTICFKSTNTTCVEDSDGVYFTDTCGNIANIYDANKIEDQSYWEKPMSPTCTTGIDCGNCDYFLGSRCYEYRPGRDTKPSYGKNICRDLSCENGRKHGESWCVSDFSNQGIGEDPVGSRHFIATCFEGEIEIEGCADFNQEICIEESGTSIGGEGFTEARCVVNEWRSCVQANSEDTYNQVKSACQGNDHCIMFLDIPGNEKYKGLPGFKEGIENKYQGSARGVGETYNSGLAHCVPKYSPGMQFWESASTATGQTPLPGTAATGGGMNYGGSSGETNTLCSSGDFICVRTKVQKSFRGGFKTDKNDICFNKSTPLLMEALNERCKRLGPCGSKVNIAGELGFDEGYDLDATKIDADGDQEDYPLNMHNLTEEYKSSLKSKPGLISVGSITSLTSLVIKTITGMQTAGSTEQAPNQPEPGEIDQAVQGIQAAFSLYQSLGGGGGRAATVAFSQGTRLSANLLVRSGGVRLLGGDSAGVRLVSEFGGNVNPITITPIDPLNPAAGVDIKGGFIGNTGVPNTEGLKATNVQATSPGKATQPKSGGMGAAGAALAAAIAGYYLGQAIGKNNGMTPGDTQVLSGILASAGGLLGTVAYYTWINSAAFMGPGGWAAAIIIAIATIIISIASYDDEYKYYILNFECEAWQPPSGGNCDLCNEDVRSCSEYRCKSLGGSCEYYTPNGEPGYCADGNDVRSPVIEPWQEILSKGHKYADVKNNGFKIQRNYTGELARWEAIDFGIETDEPALCKIDNKHTDSYDEMQYDMQQGDIETQNKMTISPHASNDSLSTLGMQQGENRYYIRCRDYIGNENKAEFVVIIKVGSGDDLTPPLIKRFEPESNGFVKKGANETDVRVYINEPAECRYSREKGKDFEDMIAMDNCVTNPSLGILGEWACFTKINLEDIENIFYFKCLDQPGLGDRASEKRNPNRIDKEYKINVCQEDLEIIKIIPNNTVVSGKSPVEVNVEVETKGCINGGRSICSYSFGDYFVPFYDTDSRNHYQNFSLLLEGEYEIDIFCIDNATNSDTGKINFEIDVDNEDPIVTRAYDLENKVFIETNENAECFYSNDKKIKCSYELDEENVSSMTGTSKIHSAPWFANTQYFIKCKDVYNNTNQNCGIIIGTV